MIVRADLDRPVAGVCHGQRQRLAAFVQDDVAVLDEHLSGNHVRLK
jgi:hypothetical protein